MKSIIFLLLIFFSSIQADKWEKNSWTSNITLNINVASDDFPTSALEIKYSVTCSSPCDILLITEANFRSYLSGMNYNALRENKGVTSDSASWLNQNDIQQHLFVAVVNKYSPYVIANVEQQHLVEKSAISDGWLLALFIIAPIICSCTVGLGIAGMIMIFVTEPMRPFLNALFPNRYHLGTSSGFNSGENNDELGESGSNGGNTVSASV